MNSRWLSASMALALFLVLVFAPTALAESPEENSQIIGGGTQRVGLVELFTAVWCGPCVNADRSIDVLYNELGEDVAIVAYHPLKDDPFGLNETYQRFDYYLEEGSEYRGYPTIMVNGRADPPIVGAPSVEQVLKVQKANLALDAGKSKYTLQGLIPQIEGENISFWLNVTGPANKENITLRVVLTEDNRYWWGDNGDGTPKATTNGVKVHRWIARHHFEALQPVNGSLNHTFVLPMGEDWEGQEMGYVAFIQDDNSGEVLQALAYYPNPPYKAKGGDSPGPGLFGLLVAGALALVLMNMSRFPFKNDMPRRPLGTSILALLLAGLLVVSFSTVVAAEEDMTPVFDAALHDPNKPDKDDTLDITLWIDDADNVTDVTILVCSKTKNLCGTPEDMEASDPQTNEEWTAENDWGMEAGHELGYKFTVKTENGSKHYFPDPDKLGDYGSYDLLDFSGDGDWYFAFEVKAAPADDDDDSPALPLMGTIAALGVALVLSRRRY